MTELTIVDYGAGNLASVQNAFTALGVNSKLVGDPDELRRAERIVLPGVGAAGSALAMLRERGLDQALTEVVRERGRPMLGICLGMQLIADKLYENGEHRGLGWVRGEVVFLGDLPGVPRTVPHMGWNDTVARESGAVLFANLALRKRQFYYSHSYTLRVADERVVAAHASYGVPVVAAVLDESVFAVQFHPEKSQQSGERLLSAFLDWNP